MPRRLSESRPPLDIVQVQLERPQSRLWPRALSIEGIEGIEHSEHSEQLSMLLSHGDATVEEVLQALEAVAAPEPPPAADGGDGDEPSSNLPAQVRRLAAFCARPGARPRFGGMQDRRVAVGLLQLAEPHGWPQALGAQARQARTAGAAAAAATAAAVETPEQVEARLEGLEARLEAGSCRLGCRGRRMCAATVRGRIGRK